MYVGQCINIFPHSFSLQSDEKFVLFVILQYFYFYFSYYVIIIMYYEMLFFGVYISRLQLVCMYTWFEFDLG